MGGKKRTFVIGAICLVFAVLLIFFVCSFFVKEKQSREEPPTQTGKEELPESREYLSITYTTGDSSTKTGRMMNFYTYDLLSDKLTKHAQLPFDSQYALGAVSLSENKIYYTRRVGKIKESTDHLFAYDLSKKQSTMLEEENFAYNDIIPVNGRLLVTTVPVHATGTGIFDPETKKFSYLYEPSITEDGYKDFLYTTAPTPLNYNPHYERFVNVSSSEKDLYDEAVRSGEKPLKYHIALVDADLKVQNEYVYSLKSLLDYTISAVTQISRDSVLLLVTKDLSEDEDGGSEIENRFYVINFRENSCRKVESPFPKMRYIGNFITADDGASYYISGENTDGVSGLFYYDCSNDTTRSILPDDEKKDNHIVNFCFIQQ